MQYFWIFAKTKSHIQQYLLQNEARGILRDSRSMSENFVDHSVAAITKGERLCVMVHIYHRSKGGLNEDRKSVV